MTSRFFVYLCAALLASCVFFAVAHAEESDDSSDVEGSMILEPTPMAIDHENDDIPIGEVIPHHEMITMTNHSSCLAYWEQIGLRQAGCVARPEQTEGPYFVEENLNRPDVRSDPTNGKVSEGAAFTLTFVLGKFGDCAPIANAKVDIWQADAHGIYSDVKDFQGLFNTIGQKFLRGFQNTNAKGEAKFVTIIPGWYKGRTVHIHFKIRVNGRDFTSQLYFDDAFIDKVFEAAPYKAHGNRSTRNNKDGIFNRQGGPQLIAQAAAANGGYAATYTIGLKF